MKKFIITEQVKKCNIYRIEAENEDSAIDKLCLNDSSIGYPEIISEDYDIINVEEIIQSKDDN